MTDPLAPFRILPCARQHVELRAAYRATALAVVTTLPDSEARRYVLDTLLANRDLALVAADEAQRRDDALTRLHHAAPGPEGAA